MNYSDSPYDVRVDFWKESGKWYTTEKVKWTGKYKDSLIHDEFKRSLLYHFENSPRLLGMLATCLEPYHEHAHPISLIIEEDWFV